jgi:hypothetical protein
MLYRAVQAWELLDPPSGWDTSGPVLATGYYHISNTALQMVMLIDDAMAQACHQGEQQTTEQQDSEHSTFSRGTLHGIGLDLKSGSSHIHLVIACVR